MLYVMVIISKRVKLRAVLCYVRIVALRVPCIYGCASSIQGRDCTAISKYL